MTTIKRTTELITLTVERHRLDGRPTCAAWHGGQGRKRRVCQFLGATHFGTRPVCLATTEPIHTDGEPELLTPTPNCPLWKD